MIRSGGKKGIYQPGERRRNALLWPYLHGRERDPRKMDHDRERKGPRLIRKRGDQAGFLSKKGSALNFIISDSPC